MVDEEVADGKRVRHETERSATRRIRSSEFVNVGPVKTSLR
jgi:hypothetical protein